MTTFSVVTVCTGNVCRSPLAEQLLRAGLAEIPVVSVSSAGTGALVGSPMDDQSRVLSAEFGGRGADEHVARQLSEEIVSGADLVLAMAREHRSAAVEVSTRALRRTFTLRELARVVEAFTDADWAEVAQADGVAARLRTLIDLAAALRGTVPPPESAEDDDVVDPFRQSPEVYRRSADELVPAARSIVSVLRRAAGGLSV